MIEVIAIVALWLVWDVIAWWLNRRHERQANERWGRLRG